MKTPLLLALILLAQSSAAQPVLHGWTALDSQAYVGKQLFGYINGGAELYHEYGFVRVDVYRFTRGRAELTVDVYEMRDPRAAYGLASLRVTAGGGSAVVGRAAALRDDIGPHGASAVVGPRWMQLTLTPPDTSGTLLPALLREVRGQFAGNTYRPAALLRAGRPDIIGHRRLIYGPLGLQSAFPSLEPMFDGLEGYELETIDVTSPKDLRLIARVRLPDHTSRNIFLARCGCDTNTVATGRWMQARADGLQRHVRLRRDGSLDLVEAAPAVPVKKFLARLPGP